MSPMEAFVDPKNHSGSDVIVCWALGVQPTIAPNLSDAVKDKDFGPNLELVMSFDSDLTAISDENVITVDRSILEIESAFLGLASAIDALSDPIPLERPEDFDVLIENALELYGVAESDEEIDEWANALAEDVVDAKD